MEQVDIGIGVEATNGGTTFLTTLLSAAMVSNVFMFAFNLLPLPPLDGSAVLNGVLPERHAERLREFQSHAVISMIGLVIAWRVFPLMTDPIFVVLLRIIRSSRTRRNCRTQRQLVTSSRPLLACTCTARPANREHVSV